MIDWLRQFPDLLLISLCAGVSIGALALTGVLGSSAAQETPTARSSTALEAYKVIVSFTAILLSFALVQAQGALRTAESGVSREAGALNTLDRVLTRYGSSATNSIRPLLLGYGRSVVGEDWPAMQRGGGATATTDRQRSINRAIQTLEDGRPSKPVLYAEMLKQLDTLNDSRQERVDGSSVGLPRVLWEANGVLCAVLLLLSCFIRMPSRLIAIGGHGVALATLIALVFVVEEPFKGHTASRPAPIERVLMAMQERVN